MVKAAEPSTTERVRLLPYSLCPMSFPTDDEVREVAAAAGLPLSEAELPFFVQALSEQLEQLDDFVRADLDPSRPVVRYPDRDPGRRPTRVEDPFNAWLWKCSIRGAATGCLAGKTVGFKDHIPVAGIPLTFGARALEDFVPDFDATVVTRALEAGAVVIGKNMLNGFTGPGGPSGVGDYGRTLNPHSADHVTGGSSSGSAAAVAAGDVDISFAGDQGGSIRIPAAWCGVVGLKPSFGLVSHFGISFGYDPSLDYVGPMARRVEDVAAALQAVAGYDPLDPRQRRETPEQLDVLGRLGDGVEGLRIGLLAEGFDQVDPGVHDAVTAAAAVLAAAGATVERISVPEHRTAPTAVRALAHEGARALSTTSMFGAFSRTYYPGELSARLDELLRSDPSQLNPRTALSRVVAEFSRRRYDGRVYAKAQNVRAAFIRAYDSALDRVDLLLMPTAGTTAPRYAGPPSAEAPVAASLVGSAGDAISRNTAPFNYTGHPALAVPCGRSQGLPVSMQLVGRRLDDALLLRAAYAFEHSVPYDEMIAIPGVFPDGKNGPASRPFDQLIT